MNVGGRKWARASCFMCMAVLTLLGGLGCSRKGTAPPEPVEMSMLPMRRIEMREQLLYRAETPVAHGYGRGDLLGVFAKIEGQLDAVGYGHVTRVDGREMELLATYLPPEHRKEALWLGPLPHDEHLGHHIGKILDSPDAGRFYIDVGQADGVRVGDTYLVYDGAITDAGFDARTLQKRPVGLLQVAKADDGRVVSLTVLRQGKAPPGAWVELVDADTPGMEVPDHRETTTVLILTLLDDRLGDDDELQRIYWKKLRDVLRSKEAALGKRSLLRLAFAERKHALVDGPQSAIVDAGREHGADIVVWGSVLHTSRETYVRPNVTFVDQERHGDEARQWKIRVGPLDDLVGPNDDVGGVDASIRGLAAWLVGLAYYEANACGDAVHPFEQVPLESDLHREWMVAQGRLFECYDLLGDWDKAERTARLQVDHGVSNGIRWYEARGRVNLAESLYDRGAYEDTLVEVKKAKALAEADGDEGTVARAWGVIGDTLYRRGDVDEALRIHKEEELPIYEKLGDIRSAAMTWGKVGDILYRRGELDEALRIRKEKQLPVFEKLKDARSVAVSWGKVADILHQRGELDQALSFYEKQLPVFEKLGDVREVAATWGKIGDILYRRGELDEALRIRKEKQLPVFEKLGDVREVAVTWGKIGDILYRRGKLAEALRIRKERELPVYEKLGDVREAAVTWGKIGNISYRRGELDEALRIRKEEQLAVFERLQDVRLVAVTWGQIADILHRRGELDEALRIRKEEELPVYEKLRDARSTAVTWGKVADVFHQRGELAEALRIRKEEQLPIYERLRDVRSAAMAWGKVADILHQQGELIEALRVRKEEQLAIYEQLGDLHSAAVTWGKVADILHQQGALDEALRIRKEKELPVYEKLEDVRAAAAAWGKVADILHQQGKLDEALHIRQKEQLPLYEKLGDTRSAAVTWRKVGAVHAAQGHVGETIAIYETKVLPSHETLNNRKGLVFDRANLAVHLLARKGKDDRCRAESLLRLALEDAEAMRLTEAVKIRRIMTTEGFDATPTP